jgi:hypothetical protein
MQKQTQTVTKSALSVDVRSDFIWKFENQLQFHLSARVTARAMNERLVVLKNRSRRGYRAPAAGRRPPAAE